jgi:hemolysin III
MEHIQQVEKIKINWNPNNTEIEKLREEYTLQGLVYYTPLEEVFNTLTHSAGVILGLIAFVIILYKASNPNHIILACIMCISYIALYATSATYHALTNKKLKQKVRKIDHAGVILVVISSGAPIVLTSPANAINYIIISLCYGLALANYVGCLVNFDKFRKIALINDFLAGILLAATFFISRAFIPFEAKMFYLASLVICLSGALVYSIAKKYTHTVFHILTVIGPACCLAAAIIMV